MTSYRRSLRNGLPLAALALTLAGCTGNAGNSGSAPPAAGGGSAASGGSEMPGVLREQLPIEPPTLDPAMTQDVFTGEMLQNAYEGLLGWNTKNELTPRIAMALPTLSADRKTYTFTLRSDAKFANGRTITAEDVKYSFTRALDPKLASPVAMSYLNDIQGAKAVADGKATELAGVKVLSPASLQITLVAPRAYFLQKLTYPTGYVVPKEGIAKGPKSAAGALTIGPENAAETASGPFKITSYERQSKVVLEPNEHYWGGKPKLTRIERPIVLDSKTAVNLYQTGRLDIVINLQQSDYTSLKNDPAFASDLHLFTRAATWYMAVNPTQYKPFADKRVRQAVAYAVDKQSIVKNVTASVFLPATGVLPPGVPGYAPTLTGYPYDLEKAKKLLAEAGYPGGKGLPTIHILFPEKQSDFTRPVEVLREQLGAVGFPVELNEMEHGAFLKALHNRQFDLAYGAWYADYLDPQDFLSLLFRSDAPENETGYSNPAFDALCAQADGEPDQAKRRSLYAKADSILVDDIPWVPIAYGRDVELDKPYVSGIQDALMSHLPHYTTAVR